MAIPNFPFEITFEILIRLPVKSLLRFRCVSKSWRSLISDPQFVKSHLNRSTTLNHQRLFITTTDHPLKFSVCDVDDDGVSAAKELDYPWGNPHRRDPIFGSIQIVGSCNGLICLLVDTSRILIFNPSTRKFRELPPPPEIGGSKHESEFCYGFGCDSSVHNYKLVRAPGYYGAKYYGDTQFMVFSLKENSWRTLNLSPDGTFVKDVGTYFNGAINWLGVRGSLSDQDYVILTLDLSSEVFLEIPLPSLDDHTIAYVRFWVFEGCLCVLSDYIDNLVGSTLTTWIMKGDGLRSWNKLVTIPCLKGTHFLKYFEPLCFLKNSEVLLNIDGEELAIYNLEERTCTSIVIDGYPYRFFDTTLYVESLLSPDGVDLNDLQ